MVTDGGWDCAIAGGGFDPMNNAMEAVKEKIVRTIISSPKLRMVPREAGAQLPTRFCFLQSLCWMRSGVKQWIFPCFFIEEDFSSRVRLLTMLLAMNY